MDKKNRDELKKLIINETEKLTPEQISQQIFEGAEALTPEQQKERNKKKDAEIIHLTGGGTTSLKQIKDFRASKRQPYRPHFHKQTLFFETVHRLNGWPLDECKRFVKRKEVAGIIMRLIYNLFPPELVAHVRKENPFVFSYIRKYKYFQYITKEGQLTLDTIIENFVSMSIGYSDWDRFEFDYCTKNNLPIQLKLNV